MALTPQDVHDKVFSPTRFAKGYSEDEVDAFLDEVEAELTRLLTENEDLRSRLAAAAVARAATPPAPVAQPAPPPVAAAPPAPPSDTEDFLKRTLLLAQRTADEAVAQARAEAERIVSEAMERAVTLERNAAQEQAKRTGELDAKRSKLEAQVEALRAFEREYRTRLKAYLEMQLRELEGGGAPAGPGPTGGQRTPATPPPAAARSAEAAPSRPATPALAPPAAPPAAAPPSAPPAAPTLPPVAPTPQTAPPAGPPPSPFRPAPAVPGPTAVGDDVRPGATGASTAPAPAVPTSAGPTEGREPFDLDDLSDQ